MQDNERHVCTTLGELKNLIKDMPDDTPILTAGIEADALHATHINTYWHGAVTLEFETDN